LDPADPIRIDKTKGPHGVMTGGAAAQKARPDDQIDFILAEKAAQFFKQQTKDAPFFLYLAFAAPHVPIDPAQEFRGKSGAKLYGDYVQQLDHCLGLVLDALEKQGLAQNTLVIFTSDNGAVLNNDALTSAHRPNSVLLGQKTDAWEAGHRVPLLARWPGSIPSGSLRAPLFTQVDCMATLAEAAGAKLPDGASPDGASELAAFTDPARAPVKRTEASFLGTGGHALRQGDWLYIPKQGSAGMTVQVPPGPQWGGPDAQVGLPNSDIAADGKIKSDAPKAQLYNLKEDLSQHTNVIAQHPDIAARMQARMDELKLRKGKGE
ncbi:MAG: sulfatase-like hydrolase/transferase, partial [Kiritimatiellaeota bacterium]|nr:sulfatase-like hydrolase/transferase [Kiritimatiellota bacterium]